MKTAILLAAAVGIANAKPHGHAHVHQKRDATNVAVVSATETAYAYVLDGKTISQDEVCNGIKSGELKWDGVAPVDACAAASSISVSSTVAPTTSSTVVSSSSSSSTSSTSASVAAAEFFAKSSSSSAAPTTSSTPSSTSTSSAAAATSTAASSLSSLLSDVTEFVASLAQDSYEDFPDGELNCSDGPPTAYGAVPVSYLGLDNWIGLQVLNSAGDDIVSTGVSGDTCTDGMTCSYACAPGWQKAQWPSTQPSDGASIGGLLCKNGKLYKTNSNSKLCSQGNGLVYVNNKASSHTSVCRTDYPGTEGETVPVDVAAGSTQPLTCPIEEDYYLHLGSYTSAQYYLNPLGTAASPGCSWDGTGGDTGNAAPIVFGVGQLNGVTWVSIQQNTPTSYAAFTGRVELQGDGLSATCYYENGQYCGASGCTEHTVDGAGCTVSTTSKVTFVITD